MWDEVKSIGSERKTNSFIRRHVMKGDGTEVRYLKKGKTYTISRLGFQTQRKLCQ